MLKPPIPDFTSLYAFWGKAQYLCPMTEALAASTLHGLDFDVVEVLDFDETGSPRQWKSVPPVVEVPSSGVDHQQAFIQACMYKDSCNLARSYLHLHGRHRSLVQGIEHSMEGNPII